MKDNIDRHIITALDYCIMVEKAKGHADEEQTDDTAFEEARAVTDNPLDTLLAWAHRMHIATQRLDATDDLVLWGRRNAFLQIIDKINFLKKTIMKTTKEILDSAAGNNSQPVSIHYGENNTPDGVLVQTLDESFIIELHDLDNGKSDFSFNTADKRLKELGKTTFNRKQALILLTYIEEVNAALVEAGGEPIAKDWYTTSELYKRIGRADYIAGLSWCFYGSHGCFDCSNRYLGRFRCRPVFAYNQA